MVRNSFVVVFGGTGFLGKHLVHCLAGTGYTIKLVSRRPSRGDEMRVAGRVGQIVSVYGDVRDSVENLERLVSGAQCVVNAVGINYETHNASLIDINAKAAESVAQAAAKQNVGQFIHISSAGVSDGHTPSVYLRSKLLGENAVRRAMPHAVIVRPNMMIGAGSTYLCNLAKMIKLLPVFPLIYCGRLRPVLVNDVAKAIVAIIEKKSSGRNYELAGDKIYSIGDITRYLALSMGINDLRYLRMNKTMTKFMSYMLNLRITRLIARPLVGSYGPILTPDQVETMSQDLITSAGGVFKDLGFAPASIVPVLSTQQWII